MTAVGGGAPGMRARRSIEGFTDGMEVKANNVGRDADGGNAPFLRETADGRFAHLKNGGELARCEKLFARRSGSSSGMQFILHKE